MSDNSPGMVTTVPNVAANAPAVDNISIANTQITLILESYMHPVRHLQCIHK
jgi:hypothetical protein